MPYDFTSIISREGMDSLAVEGLGWGFAPSAPREGFDFIPLWIADMNFPTAPSIGEALARRARHPLFGYFLAREEYYSAILGWQKRHGVRDLEKKHISYHNGVLGGVASLMRAFTAPGDRILMHSPAYIGFTHVLEDLGRRPELSPLVKDAAGIWRMDLEDMERRLKEQRIHFVIFCSPHNPTGRVWEREEIEAAMALFAKYDCVVASDEIWSDLVLPGYRHLPLQSLGPEARKRTVAFYSPSKGFNLSGLWNSYSLCYDPLLKQRMEKEGEMTHYNSLNVLSMHALIGAYSQEGAAWLEELLPVLQGNIDLVADFVEKELPGVSMSRPQSTYLVFLRCDEYVVRSGRSMDEIIQAAWDVGVGLQDGRPFFEPCGLRLNLALPRSRVEEALRRLKEYVFTQI